MYITNKFIVFRYSTLVLLVAGLEESSMTEKEKKKLLIHL